MDDEQAPNFLITLNNVSLTLPSDAGPVEILRDVDLNIARGETVGIVGPSGSGKTSLLMVIAGLERASGGDVAIDATSYAQLSEDAMAEVRGANIGIVFQDFHLIANMTALENVALPLELAGSAKPFERARETLEDVGLGHRVGHYPGQLSGGEQQRVALARAMAPGPKLILADEPTGNLDLETGEKIIELMFGLHQRTGTTLLLVTHEDRLAKRCNRQVAISDGRIASDSHAAPTAARA
tara:strand:+ start:2254 stop:2973 length:720 start_codon:yes stop_codon:yes gene_type:complete